VLRRIFGPRRDEVTGEWRKLHNEELHDLYCSPITSNIRTMKARRMRWTRHVARMGAKRNAYRLLVGKPVGRRPLGRPRRRWLDNIGMDVVEVEWSDVDWTGLAQDRDSYFTHACFRNGWFMRMVFRRFIKCLDRNQVDGTHMNYFTLTFLNTMVII
jgi:hypothetical protein